jgi:hypothetical protein
VEATDEKCNHYKLYLVQELCHITLEGAMQNQCFHNAVREPLLQLTLSVFADIAAGLAYLHSKQVGFAVNAGCPAMPASGTGLPAVH